MEEIGVPSTLDGRHPNIYYSQMRAGEGQFFRAGWTWAHVAYDNDLYPLFHTDSIGGDNITQYSDSGVDELMDDARSPSRRMTRRAVPGGREADPRGRGRGAPQLEHQRHRLRQAVKNFVQSPLQFVAYDEIWLDQ